MNTAHEQHSLKSELATIVGSDYMADDDFALWAVTNDSSPFQGKMPGVIVLPETTDEVVEIIKLARQEYPDSFAWKPPPYEYEYEKLPIEVLTGGPVADTFPD